MLKYCNIHNRTDLINFTIARLAYNAYLEIGIGDGSNFTQVACHYKIGVDPNRETIATNHVSSNDFFYQNKHKFDLIFIDGLHHQEQVNLDIANSLRCIDKNGTIVIHDCNPVEESMQIVPRQQKAWTGDVWKSYVKFKNEYLSNPYVVNMDHGLGIIECDNIPTKIGDFNRDLTWTDLESNKTNILNLVPLQYFVNRILMRKYNHAQIPSQ